MARTVRGKTGLMAGNVTGVPVKKTGLTEGPLEKNLSLVAVLDVEIQKSI